VSRGLIVAIQKSRTVVGGQQKIQVSVAIEIAVREAAPDFWLIEPAAHFAGDVAESRAALIPEKLGGLRVADVAANVAHGLVDVAIGDRQVEHAIEVRVQKGAA